jgi:hypothetical protein
VGKRSKLKPKEYRPWQPERLYQCKRLSAVYPQIAWGQGGKRKGWALGEKGNRLRFTEHVRATIGVFRVDGADRGDYFLRGRQHIRLVVWRRATEWNPRTSYAGRATTTSDPNASAGELLYHAYPGSDYLTTGHPAAYRYLRLWFT